jgi:hypothetical protein
VWVRPGEELRERHSGGTTEEGTIPSSSSPWTLDPCAGSGSIGLLCDFTMMVPRAQDPGLSAARGAARRPDPRVAARPQGRAPPPRD